MDIDVDIDIDKNDADINTLFLISYFGVRWLFWRVPEPHNTRYQGSGHIEVCVTIEC